MSKFPEYKHEKSQEWFNRALAAIPSGVYGHLGPSEGLFLPITKWPLMSDHAKGTYFWDVDGNKYLDFMCAYGPNVLGYYAECCCIRTVFHKECPIGTIYGIFKKLGTFYHFVRR